MNNELKEMLQRILETLEQIKEELKPTELTVGGVINESDCDAYDLVKEHNQALKSGDGLKRYA